MRNAVFGLFPFHETLRKVKRKLVPYPIAIDERALEQGIRQIEILTEIRDFKKIVMS